MWAELVQPFQGSLTYPSFSPYAYICLRWTQIQILTPTKTIGLNRPNNTMRLIFNTKRPSWPEHIKVHAHNYPPTLIILVCVCMNISTRN